MNDIAPKATFAKGLSATVWSAMVSSKEFQDAVGAALLQMQWNQGYAKDTVSASVNAFEMQGARDFLRILINLTSPPEEEEKSKVPRKDNLIHK